MSPLKFELNRLYINMYNLEEYRSRLVEAFWLNDGICCPSCGIPGYDELVLKNERRGRRIKEIKAKLKRDSK